MFKQQTVPTSLGQLTVSSLTLGNCVNWTLCSRTRLRLTILALAHY
jgi:hypothetical protein